MGLRRKYGNKKIQAYGQVFDSKKEFHRWSELSLLERAGEIKPEGKVSARHEHAKKMAEREAAKADAAKQ